MNTAKPLVITVLCTVLCTALVTASGIALVACGGDDSPQSGVERGKALSDVSVDEFIDMCETYAAAIDEEELISAGCYLAAALFAGSEPAACEAFAQECIANSDSADDTLSPDFDCSSTEAMQDLDDLPACASDITVGQYEDCMFAILDIFKDLASPATCTNPPEASGDDFIPIPAACSSLNSTCPELIDFDDDLV